MTTFLRVAHIAQKAGPKRTHCRKALVTDSLILLPPGHHLLSQADSLPKGIGDAEIDQKNIARSGKVPSGLTAERHW